MKSVVCLVAALCLFPVAARADTAQTLVGSMAITLATQGLEDPWGLAFLPDGTFLVAERAGWMWLARDGILRAVGGLLDVMLPADFATSRGVWLSFAVPTDGGAISSSCP